VAAPSTPMHPLLAAIVERPSSGLDAQPDPRIAIHEARIALLEAQIHEQDAALRRVLTLLIDWVERDEPKTARAPAA
jgi:general secretion pathway protein A